MYEKVSRGRNSDEAKRKSARRSLRPIVRRRKIGKKVGISRRTKTEGHGRLWPVGVETRKKDRSI